jgi:hypothetical protein
MVLSELNHACKSRLIMLKKMDEGREKRPVDTLRRTLRLRAAAPGTLAKHRADRPEGSLPSSLTKGTSIVKQHKERASESLPGKPTMPAPSKSLKFLFRDLGAGTTAALPLN